MKERMFLDSFEYCEKCGRMTIHAFRENDRRGLQREYGWTCLLCWHIHKDAATWQGVASEKSWREFVAEHEN